MSKRAIAILLAFVGVVVSVLLIVRESVPGVKSGSVGAVVASPYNGEKSKENVMAAVSSAPKAAEVNKREFSEQKYMLLRKKYRPNEQGATGALNSDALKSLANGIERDMYPKVLRPVIADIVYGRTSSLEKKLAGALNQNSTFFMSFPENTNVSLLDVAIEAGQRGAIKMLLSFSAGVNPPSDSSQDGNAREYEVPLPLAAFNGEDDVVRELLGRGANVDQRLGVMNDNPSALMQAIYGQNPSTVYMLLANGADINSVLRAGSVLPRIVLDYNVPPRLVAIRKLLLEYGAKMPKGYQLRETVDAR